jgi:hypothetical protein
MEISSSFYLSYLHVSRLTLTIPHLSASRPVACISFYFPFPLFLGLHRTRTRRLVSPQRRQRQISAGLIPMAQPPTMISDTVLNVENNNSTATGIPHSFPILLLTSPQPNLESHHKEPFRPTTWRDLTSIVHRPQRWQVDSLLPSSRTTKIPLKYRHPTTTKASSCESLQKDSVSPRPRLPKGWVYAVEEVHKEVKTEVVCYDYA